MTVYVVQQPKPNRKGWQPDLSSAAQYGEMDFIFEPHERVSMLPGPSLFKARQLLRTKFDPETDYILWPSAGDPMAFAATLLALQELDLDEVTFLIWDRKRDDFGNRDKNSGFYVPVKFILKEKKKHDN